VPRTRGAARARIQRERPLADVPHMGWRDHALRLLARGLSSRSGESLDTEILIRVIDAMTSDVELSQRLDALDERGVEAEMLARYEAERGGR
jgi:hypothetical protein